MQPAICRWIPNHIFLAVFLGTFPKYFQRDLVSQERLDLPGTQGTRTIDDGKYRYGAIVLHLGCSCFLFKWVDNPCGQRQWPWVSILYPVEQVSYGLKKVWRHSKDVLPTPSVGAGRRRRLCVFDYLSDLVCGDAFILHGLMRWDDHVNEFKQWVPEGLWRMSVFVPTGSPVISKPIKQAGAVSNVSFLGNLISRLEVIKIFYIFLPIFYPLQLQ